MAPPDGLGCRPHPAPGDFGRLHGPARRPRLSAPPGPRRLRPAPWSRPTASVVGPARHCRPATSPDSPRPTAPSGLIRLPGPVLALWEDRSREHTGCARRLPHDSAVFMRPMRGALRNDPPRAPFSAPIGRRGAGRPLAARKNGNTEACGTCGTRSGRSGAEACPNLLQRHPGPGSMAGRSAEYQRSSSRFPVRSGPLQQIWTNSAAAAPPGRAAAGPMATMTGTPTTGRGPRERAPTREHVT